MGKSVGGQFWYIYVLESQAESTRHYVGMTEDLQAKLEQHNSGQVSHTSKFRPWQIETAVAFRSKGKAVAFEQYLKFHSGRAFAKKHF